MKSKLKKFGFSDLTTIAGAAVFTWGMYENYGRAVACMVGGGLLFLFGVLASLAEAKRGN